MSEGKHPFEDDKFNLDMDKAEADEQRFADERYDEELYQRELYGRMMGEKLTPRQFALLYKIKDNESKSKFIIHMLYSCKTQD